MTYTYLKKSSKQPTTDTSDVRDTVQTILDDIEKGGDAKALEYAKKFDKYEGNLLLTKEEVEAACALVPEQLKKDIQFAHANVKKFAELQLETCQDVEVEVVPGLIAGQKSIPCQTAGCYIPGGRYSHIASAIMTVTTAKVAGCKNIIACSPPRPEIGIAPAIVYAAHICGADEILALGGVDPAIVASDLVGQAEHGYNSPVWLVTDDKALAEKVMELVPPLIADLPEVNSQNAAAAWRDYAEVILCEDREAMAAKSDEYAPEHLTVQAEDLDWWLGRLECYGSLFLGEETTVAFGDKASGTNHVLPTSRAAKYSGGLSVHKYMKIVTWQRATRDGAKPIAEATARISRLEGMEGHARTADIRLEKYFPDETFNLQAE